MYGLETLPIGPLEAQRDANKPRNGGLEWDQRRRGEVADEQDALPCDGARCLGRVLMSSVTGEN